MEKKLEKYLKDIHEIYLPQKLYNVFEDTKWNDVYRDALEKAIDSCQDSSIVLAGKNAILMAMLAARFGARQVTICEPLHSLASLYQTIIADNRLAKKVTVFRQHFTTLMPKSDLGHQPEIVVLDTIDYTLTGKGLLDCVRHAQEKVLTPGGQLLPKQAKVFIAAIEQRTSEVCSFDLNSFNRYRWNALCEPIHLGEEEPFHFLSEPTECLSFDFTEAIPIETSEKKITLKINHDGQINAFAYWFELQLDEEQVISTAPSSDSPFVREQALQYLDKEINGKIEDEIELSLQYDKQQIRSKIIQPTFEASEGLNIKPSVPHWHFPMLADNARNQAYEKAIQKAVQKNESAKVLDIGAGSGLLAMMAAKAGASSVHACEVVPHLADLAQLVFKTNRLDDKIKLIPKHSQAINVPGDMEEKANLLVSETVDHSLLGEGFVPSLVHARKELLTDHPTLIPAAAKVYAMGIELRFDRLKGFDFSALNLFRLNRYMGLQLKNMPYKQVTEVFTPFHFDFYSNVFESEGDLFEPSVIEEGCCNAVAFWYDLHLDDEIIINTGPESKITAWEQAVVFFDRPYPVKKGMTLPIYGQHDLVRFGFSVDPLEYIRYGHFATEPHWPQWFQQLVQQENKIGETTRSINDWAQTAPPQEIEKNLTHLVENTSLLGLDTSLTSDFVKQLGH